MQIDLYAETQTQKNRREEPTGLERAWNVTSRTDDVAVRLRGKADSGETKHAVRGRITLSSPRWSRLRSLELVAGSG